MDCLVLLYFAGDTLPLEARGAQRQPESAVRDPTITRDIGVGPALTLLCAQTFPARRRSDNSSDHLRGCAGSQ